MGQVSSSRALSISSKASPELFPLPSDISDVPQGHVLNVELEILSAKNIAAGDYLGITALMKGQFRSSDAYVVIQVNGQSVAWTHPVFSTLNPVWHEKFYFNNVQPDALCTFHLFDKDVTTDDDLGETYCFAVNTDGTESTFELAVSLNEKHAGTIVVKVVKSSSVSPEPGAFFYEYGPVRYSVHSSVTAGLMTMSISNDAKVESLAYHIQLHNIPHFLSTEHEWNKDYATIQPIFSSEYPHAPMLRQAILAQHAVIYTHGPNNTQYGAISSPVEFFQLIHNGTRQGKSVLFTYVITKKGWYFSETGAAFFKDMLSKHMLHSGAAFSVLYAGEFRIEECLFGEPKLLIDNDSGTYAPPDADLPQLQALVENNFPGITVEAVSRTDERSQRARNAILESWR
ncbi:hypothetical protein PsorP6_015294 [Peronosclerospora sorghi]|uniref:Uncharacterized protein n=1 Tax=Peronosclerospora sorghi TaxID=230839 RepID=A0ACC0VS13_9STRA|nr:hypothetical protein PsorP6_015294 [Peronosclerospora sorghi]